MTRRACVGLALPSPRVTSVLPESPLLPRHSTSTLKANHVPPRGFVQEACTRKAARACGEAIVCAGPSGISFFLIRPRREKSEAKRDCSINGAPSRAFPSVPQGFCRLFGHSFSFAPRNGHRSPLMLQCRQNRLISAPHPRKSSSHNDLIPVFCSVATHGPRKSVVMSHRPTRQTARRRMSRRTCRAVRRR